MQSILPERKDKDCPSQNKNLWNLPREKPEKLNRHHAGYFWLDDDWKNVILIKKFEKSVWQKFLELSFYH
jgi:hypothetical protein